jgi:hypothetical protein
MSEKGIASSMARRGEVIDGNTSTAGGLTGHVRELFEMGGLLELFMIHVSGQEAAAQGGGK